MSQDKRHLSSLNRNCKCEVMNININEVSKFIY